MVGVNRTGDGDGLHYNGHSAIYSPDGEVITTIREEECLLIGDINPGVIKEMRKTFPMKNDRREELYIKMWKNSNALEKKCGKVLYFSGKKEGIFYLTAIFTCAMIFKKKM